MLGNLSIIDESLDFNNNHTYEMSILIAESGLSFLVLDKHKQKIVAWKYYPFEPNLDSNERNFYIAKFLKNETLVFEKYHNTKVIYACADSILVPQVFYDDTQKETLYNFNLNLDPQNTVYSNIIENIDAVKLFAFPNNIYQTLQKYCPSYKLVHHSTPILQSLKLESEVYLFVSKSYFSVYVFKDGQLVLDNAFKYKTKEDALYYLLNVFLRLGIDAKYQNILFCSDMNQDKDLLDFLSDYFADITPVSYQKEYIFNHQFLEKYSPYLLLQTLSFKCE